MTSKFDLLLHLYNKEFPQELVNLVKNNVQEIISDNVWELVEHSRNSSLIFRHKYGSGLCFNCEVSISNTKGAVIFVPEIAELKLTNYSNTRFGRFLVPQSILQYVFNHVKERVPQDHFPVNYDNIGATKQAIQQLKLLQESSRGDFRDQLNILIPFVEMNTFVCEWIDLHKKYR